MSKLLLFCVIVLSAFLVSNAFAEEFAIKLSESLSMDSGEKKAKDVKKDKKDSKKPKKDKKSKTVKTKKTKTDSLPLGDHRFSQTPKIGYVYSCQTEFRGEGAFRSGDWIADSTWMPSKKPTVDGSIVWKKSSISIFPDGNTRIIEANNLPSHPTGKFPISAGDDAYKYDRNPNSIQEQYILLELPSLPQLEDTPFCVNMGMIGFMSGGAALFNAFDAQGNDAAAHEIQDKCNGHPQMNGQYHYHGGSSCAKEVSGRHSELLGYIIDGFGIFGKYGEGGKPAHNNDLDVCHGHTHTIPWDGKQIVMYHYHITEEFPYAVGCFRAGPVSSDNFESDTGPPPFAGISPPRFPHP